MKSLKQSFIAGLTLLLLISSCSIDKRIYRTGYHIEWRKSNHTLANTDLVSTDNSMPIQSDNSVLDGKKNNTTENNFADSDVEQNISASLDENTIIIPSTKQNVFENKQRTSKSIIVTEKTTIKLNRAKFTHKRQISTSNNSGDGMTAKSMLTLGWVFTGIAILSLFVLWPLIFFLIPGLFFLIMGYRKKNGSSKGSNKNNSTSDLQDVVYLKNGSIIRGLIIEQIPNVSLKIQTADGSVFVYKIDEIEKMTKEPSK